MIKQKLSCILIYLMLFTPLASAYDYCTGVMDEHMSINHSMESSPKTDQQQSQNLVNDCHFSSHCNVFYITPLASNSPEIIFQRYSIPQHTLSISSYFSPEIRPPITL